MNAVSYRHTGILVQRRRPGDLPCQCERPVGIAPSQACQCSLLSDVDPQPAQVAPLVLDPHRQL